MAASRWPTQPLISSQQASTMAAEWLQAGAHPALCKPSGCKHAAHLECDNPRPAPISPVGNARGLLQVGRHHRVPEGKVEGQPHALVTHTHQVKQSGHTCKQAGAWCFGAHLQSAIWQGQLSRFSGRQPLHARTASSLLMKASVWQLHVTDTEPKSKMQHSWLRLPGLMLMG